MILLCNPKSIVAICDKRDYATSASILTNEGVRVLASKLITSKQSNFTGQPADQNTRAIFIEVPSVPYRVKRQRVQKPKGRHVRGVVDDAKKIS